MREPVLDRSRYQNFKAEGAPDDFHHVAWKTMKYDEMIPEQVKKLMNIAPEIYEQVNAIFIFNAY